MYADTLLPSLFLFLLLLRVSVYMQTVIVIVTVVFCLPGVLGFHQPNQSFTQICTYVHNFTEAFIDLRKLLLLLQFFGWTMKNY